VRAPDIQFAHAPRRSLAFGIAALVLGVIVVASSTWNYYVGLQSLRSVDARIANAEQDTGRRSMSPRTSMAPTIPEQRASAINNAIARLNIPWREVFAAIEAEQPADIALLALLPDARQRVMLVQAEALNHSSMLDFVARLRANSKFEDVYLTKHERREQDIGQPYRFAVQARWKEES